MTPRHSSPTESKNLVRAFYEGYNEPELAPVFDRHVADGVAVHALGQDLDRATWLGIDAAMKEAFSDYSMVVLEQLAEGDKVATRWVVSGTQRSEFYGVPSTGRAASLTGTAFDRVEDGVVVEHWLEVDITGFLQRLAGDPS